MGQVRIVVEGKTKKECQQARENVFANYHPSGYGTYIEEPKKVEDKQKWIAYGYRWSTCD
jgi:hypothetical protein